MRFMALACDYDGTLASHNRIAAPTIAALERARSSGLRLLLVTGRAFFELIRVCERLDPFDVVVAENGGLLYFPADGRISDMAVEPPARLLAELDRRGVAYHAGRVVIGTTRDYEPDVRAALAATGVSLALVANRGSLMLLPHGVDKGSGVRHVIRMLGLSTRDVLALGDSENDVSVGDIKALWGSPFNRSATTRPRAVPPHAAKRRAGTRRAGATSREPAPGGARHRTTPVRWRPQKALIGRPPSPLSPETDRMLGT